jgi:hypothetical protein
MLEHRFYKSEMLKRIVEIIRVQGRNVLYRPVGSDITFKMELVKFRQSHKPEKDNGKKKQS